MSREMGPREKAMREMREAKYDRAMARATADMAPIRKADKAALKAAIAEAAKKRGKPRKAKKK